MTAYERVQRAWSESDRSASLNRVVELMAGEGVDVATLDDALGRLLDEARTAGCDEAEEEAIAAVGDRIHGWCHASRKLNISAQPIATPIRPTMTERERDALRPTAPE